MSSLLVRDAVKVYPGGVRAVDRVSLEVRDGEFVVLVGPSGCGKSTLLRLIAGLEEFTEGSLRIGDRDATHLPARQRDIAMVFQNYALYPHMDVRRNLAFGLLQRRRHRGLGSFFGQARRARREELAAIDRRVDRAASMLGLEAMLDRRPSQLSGGQRQRVALGRALVREPSVFLFDEPLSNLDAKLRHEMRTELRILHRQLGATMIHVTHDQEEAMSLGDRIVVMRGGRVMQAGPPSELYRTPANRFVAGFVGSPAMNFAEGTLRRESGRLRFAHGASTLDLPEAAIAGIPSASSSGIGGAASSGEPVVLGIRPEHLAPAGAGDAAGALTLPARVEAVEFLGDRADLLLHTPLGRWTMRTAASTAPREGAETSVALDAGAVHFFRTGAEGERL